MKGIINARILDGELKGEDIQIKIGEAAWMSSIEVNDKRLARVSKIEISIDVNEFPLLIMHTTPLSKSPK